jgi:biotin carboxyl carrier protein
VARRVTLRFDDTVADATVHPDGRVEIVGETFTVIPRGPGQYLVAEGGRRWQVAVAGPPEARWVSVNGRVAVIDTSPDTASRGRSRSGSLATLAAPMPATVVKILVEPGAHVVKGDTLLVLEAMKMELPVRAPRDGVVSTVACRQGELVQPGVNLLELD